MIPDDFFQGGGYKYHLMFYFVSHNLNILFYYMIIILLPIVWLPKSTWLMRGILLVGGRERE